MPRRYRRKQRSRYASYESSASYPRRRRTGCLTAIARFFRRLLITLLLIGASVLSAIAILWIIFHFAAFLQILIYALYVGAGLAVLGVIYLLIRLFTAISRRLSAASLARSKARLEREKVKQSQIAVQAQRIKLAQEASRSAHRALEQGQHPRSTRVLDVQPASRPLPRPTFRIEQQSTPAPTTSSQSSTTPLAIPGMPAKGQVFHYREYRHLLRPGQLIAGIRQDGSADIRSWDDFKILLILGASSSGKTTTIVEKCVCAAQMGGRLVICDPHAVKPDSLTRRIPSLHPALLPGTVMAVEHPEIMHNVRLVHAELERRRRGSSIDVPIFLVIEELNRLMRDKAIAAELSTFLEELGQEARGYNIFAILCTQRVTRLADIRNSVIASIVHKVSPMESSKCLPARYAKYSAELGVGQTFVYDADGTVEPLQQVFITEQDVEVSMAHTQTTTKLPALQSNKATTKPSAAPGRQQQQTPGKARLPRAHQQRGSYAPGQAHPFENTSPAKRHVTKQASLPAKKPDPAPIREPQPARRMPVTEELVPAALPPKTSVTPAKHNAFDLLASRRDNKRRQRA